MKDLGLQLLDARGMERSSAISQFIENDSKRPYIYFMRVVFVLQYLRRYVKRGSFDRAEEVGRSRHLLRKAEVAQLDLLTLEQDVLRLQISMQDPILVQVKHRRKDLLADVPDSLLRQPAFLLQQFGKVIACVLHNDHHLFRSLEELLHSNHILVLELRQQLRLGPQIADLVLRAPRMLLGDAFESGELVVEIAEVHLAEGALAEHANDVVFADLVDLIRTLRPHVS